MKDIDGAGFVNTGGSIRLAMDGDALARLADLGGVGEMVGALKGLCATGGASIVVERTGS